MAQHDALCGASLASPALAQRCGPSVAPAASSHKHSDASSAATSAPEQQHQHGSMDARATASSGVAALSVVALLALAAEQPALAADVAAPTSNPFNELTANSLYVTLALFLMSVPGPLATQCSTRAHSCSDEPAALDPSTPTRMSSVRVARGLTRRAGIWSQIKRAPAANKKRKTYEVDGPGRAGAMSLKDRAKQIVTYFKKCARAQDWLPLGARRTAAAPPRTMLLHVWMPHRTMTPTQVQLRGQGDGRSHHLCGALRRG